MQIFFFFNILSLVFFYALKDPAFSLSPLMLRTDKLVILPFIFGVTVISCSPDLENQGFSALKEWDSFNHLFISIVAILCIYFLGHVIFTNS